MQNGRIPQPHLQRDRDHDGTDIWLWVVLGILWCVCVGLIVVSVIMYFNLCELSDRVERARSIVYYCDSPQSPARVLQCEKS